MFGYIKDIDWVNAEAMKYWSIPTSCSLEKKKKEITDSIYSGDYWGALKIDGYYQRLVKDEEGNCFMIARNKNVNGKPINKLEWVPQLHDFMQSLPNGTVLLSECYLPNNEGSKNVTTLLGCLKEKCVARQKEKGSLHFYIFDICAWNGENWINKPAVERFEVINNKIGSMVQPHKYVKWAKYYNGKELWNKLQSYLADGKEGMVITRSDCGIYFKRTPAHLTIKIKKELQETLDVFVMGANAPTIEYTGKNVEEWQYWFDEKTHKPLQGKLFNDWYTGKAIRPITKNYFYGWAGSLKIGVMREGKEYQIGSISGLTEEILQNWKQYIGKVMEVTAMQITEDNALRHPKFVKWREDKSKEECLWEQIK